MSLYQEEYPQIYPAREIVNSSAYPSAPYEPKEPKPFDMQPPSKFPGLGKHLKGLSICVLCAIISLGLCIVAFNPLFSFLLIAFGIGVIVFLYKVYTSFTLGKTFRKRQEDYQEALTKYNESLETYSKLKAKFIEEKEAYDSLCQQLKTQQDILNYRLNHRQEFLKKVKSKNRHRGFFDLDGPKNPKLGRAEYSFRNFIDAAKSQNHIPPDFEFYFDASIMLVSRSGYHGGYFYPDLVVLTPRGLLIDVEIDEPYVAETKKPIHCIHSLDTGDYLRNQFFVNANCSVLRFSERQIIKYPEVCLNIIMYYDDYASIPSDMQFPPDFKEKSWNEEMAKRLAAVNYRDTY